MDLDITLVKLVFCVILSFFFGYVAGYLTRHCNILIHEKFKDEEEEKEVEK